MARDDGGEAKVAAAVAVTAVLFSPRVRGLLRRGAVHGLAGVLTAGDALASFARGVSRGIQESTTRGARAEPPAAGPDAPPVAEPAAAPSPPSGAAASATAGLPRRVRTRRPAQRETDVVPASAATTATASEAPNE